MGGMEFLLTLGYDPRLQEAFGLAGWSVAFAGCVAVALAMALRERARRKRALARAVMLRNRMKYRGNRRKL